MKTRLILSCSQVSSFNFLLHNFPVCYWRLDAKKRHRSFKTGLAFFFKKTLDRFPYQLSNRDAASLGFLAQPLQCCRRKSNFETFR